LISFDHHRGARNLWSFDLTIHSRHPPDMMIVVVFTASTPTIESSVSQTSEADVVKVSSGTSDRGWLNILQTFHMNICQSCPQRYKNITETLNKYRE
jgi:hypothetical protein